MQKYIKYISATIWKFELIKLYFWQFSILFVLIGHRWDMSASAGHQPIKVLKIVKKRELQSFQIFCIVAEMYFNNLDIQL